MGLKIKPEAKAALSEKLDDLVRADPATLKEILCELNDSFAVASVLPYESLLNELDFRDKKPAAKDTLALMGRISEVPSEVMLEELKRRGGHPGAVAEAVLLCVRKSADYNQGMGHLDPHTVDRSAYFPFGAASYAQMIHTKSQRFNSLVKKAVDGGEPNFEGLRDTALDLINYAGFFVADDSANGKG